MTGEASLLAGQDDSTDQIDEWERLEDERVVESAARHEQEIGQSPSAIFVLTREDIATSGATSVVDLLRQVPGIEAKFNTQSFPSVTSRIFWSDDGARILVLIDGREANYELVGNTIWLLQPISLNDIERIEVIRGPASSLYGANAVAGVINITTRAIPNRTSVWGLLQGGEVGFESVDVRGTTKIGNLGLSLGLGGEQALRPTNPSDWGKRAWKLRAIMEYRFSDSQRLMLDGSMSSLDGTLANTLGIINTKTSLRTLRLAYESSTWQAQLYWNWSPAKFDTNIPLTVGGTTFAKVRAMPMDAHVLDSLVQWRLPTFWEPLLFIAGAGGRVSFAKSDAMLDGTTFADPTSPNFHKPGLSYIEGRGGAFLHGEWTAFSWLVVTAGVRYDYNSLTGGFLSPRLALVLKPFRSQYIRLGATRAFRKPTFLETTVHTQVDFPKGSPIQGTAQDKFQEFMARVLGNEHLSNEELRSLEAGYWGSFLDNRLVLTLDGYYNWYSNLASIESHIAYKNGFIDITESSAQFQNSPYDIRTFGLEFSARFSVSREIDVFFSWAHREGDTDRLDDPPESARSPKNYLTLGGRFRLDSGLIGSLYAFARSDFYDPTPQNSGGLFASVSPEYKESELMLFGKLGWRWLSSSGIEMEAGVKVFQPITPFAQPHWRYIEKQGAMDATGKMITGEELQRSLIGYLQGSF